MCVCSHYLVSKPGGALQQRLSGVFVHDETADLRGGRPSRERVLWGGRATSWRARRVHRRDLCVCLCVERKTFITTTMCSRISFITHNAIKHTQKQALTLLPHLSLSGCYKNTRTHTHSREHAQTCTRSDVHTRPLLFLAGLKIALSPPLECVSVKPEADDRTVRRRKRRNR